MPLRLALLAAVGLCLLPTAIRLHGRKAPAPPGPCVPEGRGVPPRHWLGCAGDPGPPRDLADEERLILGLPLDPNRASGEALGFVPGLGPRLAAEIVADRAANGSYADVAELDRVRGIGPGRLRHARPHLEVPRPP
jgi:competence protein ComEA